MTTSAIILIAACSSAGCAGDAAIRSPLSRDPGPAPAYLTPEQVASPAARHPAVDAARHDAGRRIANAKIECGREDWERMRAAMVKGEALPASADLSCAKADALRTTRSKPAPKRRWFGG